MTLILMLEWARSNVNVTIESTHATFYVLEIAMCDISVTVCKIFTVKMCMILILILELAKVKCKYANGKATCNFLFVGSSSVCPICHRL